MFFFLFFWNQNSSGEIIKRNEMKKVENRSCLCVVICPADAVDDGNEIHKREKIFCLKLAFNVSNNKCERKQIKRGSGRSSHPSSRPVKYTILQLGKRHQRSPALRMDFFFFFFAWTDGLLSTSGRYYNSLRVSCAGECRVISPHAILCVALWENVRKFSERRE
jgi:hypothetical protein